MPVAVRPAHPARRSRLLALGAGAAVAALALAGCTKEVDEAPEPVTIDVVGGTFPDALDAGVIEVLGEGLDTGYSTSMLDDGSVLVSGSSDGDADDSVGVLDPATGEVTWVATAEIPEDATIIPGDITDEWVTWSVEMIDGVTPDNAIPFVYAFDREAEKTYVLADGTGAGGFAPGTSGARVLIEGGIAVWEGAVPLDAATDGAGGGGGADGTGAEGSDEAADDLDEPLEDEIPDEDEPLGEEFDEQEVPLDDEWAVASTVFARVLDATADVLTLAPEATGVDRDYCVEGMPVAVQVTTDEGPVRRTVTADGALGATFGQVAAAEGEDVWLRCGAGGVVETVSEDGGVVAKAVLRGEGRDIVLMGDGVADIQVVGLTKEWAAVWVGDLDTAYGPQLLVHRPTGKAFSLGESESQMLILRPGFVAFGADGEALEFPEDELGDEELSDDELGDEELSDDELGDEELGDGEPAPEQSEGSVGGQDEADAEESEDIEVIDGEVEVVDEELGDDGLGGDDLADEELMEDDLGDDLAEGGVVTTIARLIAPQA
ncbi:hypothetical protein ACTVCO_02040 [Sanguibacter sp. A247]|uniref:hypothetical protein n=1 Tax=unclassified Sanguibacter TaxID=2645534 RepID=UPI003FD84FF4